MKPARSSCFVERPLHGRRLVVSDVHGCARTLAALIQRVALTRQDQLFLLGDYVDRGPRSAETLHLLIQLIADGFAVFPLRGNHEQYLLEAVATYPPDALRTFVEFNESTDLLAEGGGLQTPFVEFLRELPYYYELDEFLLVHAGFNFASRRPFQDWRAMLDLREFDATAAQTRQKRVVHGHQVTGLAQIQARVAQRATVLPLDNGCCFAKLGEAFLRESEVKLGNLCCLELDTFTLIVQPNLDFDDQTGL